MGDAKPEVSERARRVMTEIIGNACISTEQFERGCRILDREFLGERNEALELAARAIESRHDTYEQVPSGTGINWTAVLKNATRSDFVNLLRAMKESK